MKKKLIKKLLCIGVILCTNITSFAAIVSDNDGSAFVTKAEFNALKNSFNRQIDDYNASIDGKIDGSIAAYLAGIALSSTSTEKILVPKAAEEGVYAFNAKNPLDYSICYPVISGQSFRVDIYTQTDKGVVQKQPVDANIGAYALYYNPPTNTSKNKGNKTLIKNLYQNATAGKSIASWDGYHIDCLDKLILRENGLNTMYGTGFVRNLTANWKYAIGKTGLYQDVSYKDGWWIISQLRFADFSNNPPKQQASFCWGPQVYALSHDWGTSKYPYICVSEAYDYDMFSNYDRDNNWSYSGNYMKQFPVEWDAQGKPTKYAKNSKITRPTDVKDAVVKYVGTDGSQDPNMHLAWNLCIANMNVKGWYSNAKNAAGTVAPAGQVYQWEESSPAANNFCEYGYTNNASTWYQYVPMIGFETKYLTNWKQIYIDDYDVVVNDNTLSSSTVETIISEVKSGSTVKHLSVCAGFPVIKIPKKNKINNFTIKFDSGSETDEYDVWFKLSPFKNGNPDDDADCFEDIVIGDAFGIEKDLEKNHAFKVSGKETKIQMKDYLEKDAILYMKWAKINTGDRSKDGGGILYPSGLCTFQKDNS